MIVVTVGAPQHRDKCALTRRKRAPGPRASSDTAGELLEYVRITTGRTLAPALRSASDFRCSLSGYMDEPSERDGSRSQISATKEQPAAFLDKAPIWLVDILTPTQTPR